MASTEFVDEGGGVTLQGKEDLKIFKMAPRAQLEFVGEGADVTGKGEDFQNFKMALRAFRIGATYWMFKVHWVRVGIWARLGKFSRFTYWMFKVLWVRVGIWARLGKFSRFFILTPPIGCLRYFGSASVFGPALVNFPGFSIHFVLTPPIGCLRYFGPTSIFGPALINFPGYFFIHFVLASPVGCLRYFGHASSPRNLRTRAGIGAQARSRPIRGNSNRVFDDDL